ncbi:MAG: pantoate--beta-alanine ligase [Candidatus Brocadiales bacterium]
MEVVKKTGDMKDRVCLLKARGQTIGFVPTMGALHEGHLSLIRRARAENDSVVLSIFVNPVQFDRKDDFLSYPRQLERDLEVAFSEGVDIVFAPGAGEIYPEGYSTYVEVVGDLTSGLCGASRPGHFRGVTTVVTKLFNIVRPDRAYFGQKDFQQAAVIKGLVRDLEMDVDVVILPTVREADGLAISSRNQYLTDEERQMALSIHKALERATELFASGERDTKIFVREMRDILNRAGVFAIDYVSIVDPGTLEELDEARPHHGAVAVIAAWVGSTRLIDNMALGVGSEPQSFLHRKIQTV